MNGKKKKKNKKLILDLGKVSHYLRRDLGLKSFLYEQIILLLKFNTYDLHILESN